MKVFKKFVVTAVTAAMVLGMTGCGGSSDGGSANASTDGVITLKIAHGASETYHMHRAIEKFKEIVEGTGQVPGGNLSCSAVWVRWRND